MRREPNAIQSKPKCILDVEEVASPHYLKQIQDAASKHDCIHQNDWRNPLPATQSLTPVHAEDDVRSIRDFRSGSRTPGGYLYQDLKPGTIVWHRDIRQLFNAATVPHGWTIVKNANDRAMIQKGRYWIIVENLPSSEDRFEVKEVAIYSNGDTGLQFTPIERHHEYFSLCPRHVHESRFENRVPKNPLLKIDWMRSKPGEHSKLQRSTMLVHWPDVQKFDLNINDMRLIGAIGDASQKALCYKVLAAKR